MVLKKCATCGQEFETRPVYHNCPKCRDEFDKKMDDEFRQLREDGY